MNLYTIFINKNLLEFKSLSDKGLIYPRELGASFIKLIKNKQFSILQWALQTCAKTLKGAIMTDLNLNKLNLAVDDRAITLLCSALKSQRFLIIKKLTMHGQYNTEQQTHKKYITAKGAKTLASSKEILDLDLSHNLIGDKGAGYLANHIFQDELIINNCNVSETGLAALLKNDMLTRLDHYSNPIKNPQKSKKLYEKIEEKLFLNLKGKDPQKATAIKLKKEKEKIEYAVINAVSDGNLISLTRLLPLIDNGVEFRETKEATSLLSNAAYWGHQHIVEYLLNCGANIEKDGRNYTPLFDACEKGHSKVVSTLLEYSANILGEFEKEDCHSIALFKLCDNIIKLNQTLISNNQTPPNFIKNISTITDNDKLVPWKAIKTPKIKNWATLKINTYFSHLKLLLNNKKITLNEKSISQHQTANSYRAITQTLEKYIHIAQEKVNKEELITNCCEFDDFSDDSDDESAHQITSKNYKVTPITKKNNEQQKHDNGWLDKLNNEIKDKGINKVDWRKYPKLLIANYRGIHFYRDSFTENQYRQYRTTCHLNRMTASTATYELSSMNSTSNLTFTKESELKANTQKIKIWQKSLDDIKDVQSDWSDRQFKTGRHMHQQRYTNSYPGFSKDLNTEGKWINTVSKSVGHTTVPFVSTAIGPKQALLYGFGQKAPKGKKEYRLRPRFAQSGKPQHPYPGKIFIFLFSPTELLAHDVNHVQKMHSDGDIDVHIRIVSEGEVSAAGGIQQKNNFYEATLKIPSFETYKTFYPEKYGINNNQFQAFKDRINSSTAGTNERKKVKNDIINQLIKYQSKHLLNLTKEEVNRRDAILVYQNLEGGFSLIPPNLKEIKEKHKNSITKPVSKKRKIQNITKPINKKTKSTSSLFFDEKEENNNTVLSYRRGHDKLEKNFDIGNYKK